MFNSFESIRYEPYVQLQLYFSISANLMPSHISTHSSLGKIFTQNEVMLI